MDPQSRMPTNFDLSKYNDYIEIVRDQIKCAQEASHILQRSYQDLQNIDIPGNFTITYYYVINNVIIT